MDSHIPFLYYDRKLKTRRYNDYLRDTLDPFDVSDRCFIDNYRLPKHLVHQLILDIKPFIDEEENILKIPLHLEVLCTLNFYASGSHQRRVGLNGFAIMSQSKVSHSIARISKLIGTKLVANNIMFPTTLAAANKNKNEFLNKFGVPGILGLIDCTHVAIANVKKQDEYAYVNRKGFHSINCQAICDLNMRILSINARYPGSTHDSHIWDGSVIKPVVHQLNIEDDKTWLFGDSGYALKAFMMVPYRRPETAAQIQFNKAHTQIRSGIERCFGILKSVFRCLKTSSGHLHYDHTRAGYIIYSCAVLHNILINNHYPMEDYLELDEEAIPVDNAAADDISGEENRQYLVNYIQERAISF